MADDSRFADSILNAVPLPLLQIGANERIQKANPPAQALFAQALEGHHYITVLRQPTLLDTIEACLREGTERRSRYLAPGSQHQTTYQVICTPVPDPTTSAGQGVLVSFEDISHVEEAGQMRSDFVANVSHELRTPLTALLGFIETLRSAAKDDAPARARFLAIMERESLRMNRLVGDLLSLSRVEAEERIRPAELVDITGLVNSAVLILRPLAEEAGIEIRMNAPDHEIEVLGDADQLQQVFINLIENAVKYGDGGDIVDVRVVLSEHEPSLRGPGVRIDVTDHGDGIEQVHIPRLTERFYRVDSHRSREMGGTGLGLAIVKHIVNRHRGRLRISSEIGRGSRFSVILPVG